MTKQKICVKIAEATGLSQSEAKKSLDATLGTIEDSLTRDEKVTFIGFGSFSTATRKARKGRNPRTGEEIDIPASKTVKFAPGRNLKEILNP
jgi:DNA-binding protein HU-beta